LIRISKKRVVDVRMQGDRIIVDKLIMGKVIKVSERVAVVQNPNPNQVVGPSPLHRGSQVNIRGLKPKP
jgi:hypothetical protein